MAWHWYVYSLSFECGNFCVCVHTSVCYRYVTFVPRHVKWFLFFFYPLFIRKGFVWLKVINLCNCVWVRESVWVSMWFFFIFFFIFCKCVSSPLDTLWENLFLAAPVVRGMRPGLSFIPSRCLGAHMKVNKDIIMGTSSPSTLTALHIKSSFTLISSPPNPKSCRPPLGDTLAYILWRLLHSSLWKETASHIWLPKNHIPAGYLFHQCRICGLLHCITATLLQSAGRNAPRRASGLLPLLDSGSLI